jgi:hypothetical protein
MRRQVAPSLVFVMYMVGFSLRRSVDGVWPDHGAYGPQCGLQCHCLGARLADLTFETRDQLCGFVVVGV